MRSVLGSGPPTRVLSVRSVKRLLIVEDNALVVQLLCQLLEEQYTLSVAQNGKLGVEAAKAQQPDLILMDLTMPVMDGWAAIRAIRGEPKTSRIPIIALSGCVDTRDVARAMDAGADAHLPKPLDEEALLLEIERLLDRAPVVSGVRSTRSGMDGPVDSSRKASR